MNRRALILEGAQAASAVRDRLELDLVGPIDPYAVAAGLGIRVRFLSISMEGFYQKGKPSRIMLSSLRPLARRAFTCAHEVGHHWFGHGSTIDELQGDDRENFDIPEEILCDAFAGFLLMPSIGLRRAFNSRGWKPETATPVQILTIASEFGVGYRTLLTHLGVTLGDMPRSARTALAKWTPQRIRRRLLGDHDVSGLAILDANQCSAGVDLEQGFALAVPCGATVKGDALKARQSIEGFDVYDAVSRGRALVTTVNWQAEARVAPEHFVGPAQYRFLEDPDE